MRRDLSIRVSAPALFIGVLAVLSFVKAPNLAVIAGIPYSFFVWSWMPRRGGAFDAALPIRGRELFAARYLSSLTIMLIPFMVAAIVGVSSDARDFSPAVVLEYMSIIALGALLPYGISPGQVSEPPLWLTALVWAALAAASAIILKVLDPFAGIALFLGATVIVAHALWRDLPDSLQLTGKRIAADTQSSPGLHRGLRSSFSIIPIHWRAIIRSQFPARVLFYYFLLAFNAAAGNWLIALPVTVFGLTGTLRLRMRWLEAYPLSHHPRLFFVLVPSVILSMICLEAGQVVAAHIPVLQYRMNAHAPEPSANRDYWHNRTKVRLEYWQPLKANPVPLIVAPWGESTVADTLSILGTTFYDPYTTIRASSDRFVEWQFARATTAVYGYPISLSDSGALIRAEPMITGSPVMKLLNAGATIAFALFLCWVLEVSRWSLLGRHRMLRQFLNATFFAVYISGIVLWFKYVFRAGEIVRPFAEKALWWEANALPANIVIVAIAAITPVIVMYMILEWQFGRSELTARVPKTQS